VLATLIDDQDLASKRAAIQAVLANSGSRLQAIATRHLDDLLGASDPDARVAGLDALDALLARMAQKDIYPSIESAKAAAGIVAARKQVLPRENAFCFCDKSPCLPDSRSMNSGRSHRC